MRNIPTVQLLAQALLATIEADDEGATKEKQRNARIRQNRYAREFSRRCGAKATTGDTSS